MPPLKDIANAATSVADHLAAQGAGLEGNLPARLVKVGSLKPGDSTAFHRPEVSETEINSRVGAGLSALNEYGGAVTNRHLLLKQHLTEARERGFFSGITGWFVGVRGTPLEASVRLKRGGRAKITLTGFGTEVSATALRAPEINKLKAFIAKILGPFTSRFDDWRKESQVRDGYKAIGEDLRAQFREQVRDSVNGGGSSLEDGQLDGFIKTLYRLTPAEAKEVIRGKVEEILPPSMRTPDFLTGLGEGLFYDPEVADARNEGRKISAHLAGQIYAGVVDGVFEGHRNLVSALLGAEKAVPADQLHRSLGQAIEANFTALTEASKDVLNASTLQPKIDGVRENLLKIKQDLSDPAKSSILGTERREDLLKVVDSRLADLKKIEDSNRATLAIVGTPGDGPDAKTLHGVSTRLGEAVLDPTAAGITSESAAKTFYLKAQSDLNNLKKELASGLASPGIFSTSSKFTAEQWASLRDHLETASKGLVNGAEFVLEEAAIRGEFTGTNIRAGEGAVLRDRAARFRDRFDAASPDAVLSAVPESEAVLRNHVQDRATRLLTGARALDSYLKSEAQSSQFTRKLRQEVGRDPSALPAFLQKADQVRKFHESRQSLRNLLVEQYGVSPLILTESKFFLDQEVRGIVRAALGLPEDLGTVGPDAPLLDLLASKVQLSGDLILPLRNWVLNLEDTRDTVVPGGSVFTAGERALGRLHDAIQDPDPARCSAEVGRIADQVYGPDRAAALKFKLALLGGEGKEEARKIAERSHQLHDAEASLQRALANRGLVAGLSRETGVPVNDASSLLRAVQALQPRSGEDYRVVGEVLSLHARLLAGGEAALADVNDQQIGEIVRVSSAIAELATNPGAFDAAKATLYLSRIVHAIAPGESNLDSETIRQGISDGLHVAPALRNEIEKLNVLEKRCVEKLNLNQQAIAVVEGNYGTALDRLAGQLGTSHGELRERFESDKGFVNAVTQYVLYNGYKQQLAAQALPETGETVGPLSDTQRRNAIGLPPQVLAESSRSAAGEIGRFNPSTGEASGTSIFSRIGRYFTRRESLEAKDEALFYDPGLAAGYAEALREKKVLDALNEAGSRFDQIISGFAEEAAEIGGQARQLTYQRLLTAAVAESWKSSGLPADKYLLDDERRGAITARLAGFGITVQEFPALSKELDNAVQAAGAGQLDSWINGKVARYTEEDSALEVRNAKLDQELARVTEDLRRAESDARLTSPNLPTVWTAINASSLPHFLNPSATWVKASGTEVSLLGTASFSSGIDLASRVLNAPGVKVTASNRSLQSLLTELQQLDQDIRIETERVADNLGRSWSEEDLLARRDHAIASILRFEGKTNIEKSIIHRLKDDHQSLDAQLGQRIALLVPAQDRRQFLERISVRRAEAFKTAPAELPERLRIPTFHTPLPPVEQPLIGEQEARPEFQLPPVYHQQTDWSRVLGLEQADEIPTSVPLEGDVLHATFAEPESATSSTA